MTSRPFTGIIPAAGMAARLRPLRYAKELLPMAYARDTLTGAVRPVPVAEWSLKAMRDANVARCVMVIADRKTELVRYFGNGAHVGVNIAYVDQPEPAGLALAIDEAYHWVRESNVCLALPDTIFEPRDGLARICRSLVTHDADVVLGLFPTDTPESLGPVRFDANGRVTEVREKPLFTDVRNTWGIAAWSPRFTELLHESAPQLEGQSIGAVFDLAVQANLDVRAEYFDAGRYVDLGTVNSLGALVLPPDIVDDEPAHAPAVAV